MHGSHVPTATGLDQLILVAQLVVTIGLIVAAYGFAKLRLGWWHPPRPHR
jgi:hypothetical protein